jgi:hypothetical protein
MTKPIPDKAEIALDYPDKFYIGTFERTARFEAHLDRSGVSLALYSGADAEHRKAVRAHINYELFADILRDLASTVAEMQPDDVQHRESLADAARTLHEALEGRAPGQVRRAPKIDK